MASNIIDGDFRSLTVTLGGRPYPLKVLPEDEDMILRIVRELQDRMSDLTESYPSRDKQDCLAMLLLIYSVDYYKVKERRGEPSGDPALINALDHLGELLLQATSSPEDE